MPVISGSHSEQRHDNFERAAKGKGKKGKAKCDTDMSKCGLLEPTSSSVL